MKHQAEEQPLHWWGSIFNGKVWAGQTEEGKAKFYLAQQQAEGMEMMSWPNTQPLLGAEPNALLYQGWSYRVDATGPNPLQPQLSPGKMLRISVSPLSLVYHLEKARPSTAQADATVTPISEGNFCHYMCNHFSALCPSDVPTFRKKNPTQTFPLIRLS